MLKPQDVLVGLKAATIPHVVWSFAEMAEHTGLSTGAVFASVKRCRQAGLLVPAKGANLIVNGKAFLDFLIHGMPVSFFPQRGEVVMGIPTARAARRDVFPAAANEIALVWVYAGGNARGESLKPIYPSVPEVASKDGTLYELLVNCDLIRAGNAKEKTWACKAMQDFLVARGLY